MNRLQSLLMLLFILFFALTAFAETDPTIIDDLTWGLSQDEVRLYETNPIVLDDPGLLGVKGSYKAMDCFIYYHFNKDDQLNRVTYILPQENADVGYASYLHFKVMLLNPTYGHPIKQDLWQTSEYEAQYADRFETYLTAIRLGYVTPATHWTDDPEHKVTITHAIKDGQSVVTIVHSNPEM